MTKTNYSFSVECLSTLGSQERPAHIQSAVHTHTHIRTHTHTQSLNEYPSLQFWKGHEPFRACHQIYTAFSVTQTSVRHADLNYRRRENVLLPARVCGGRSTSRLQQEDGGGGGIQIRVYEDIHTLGQLMCYDPAYIPIQPSHASHYPTIHPLMVNSVIFSRSGEVGETSSNAVGEGNSGSLMVKVQQTEFRLVLNPHPDRSL